MYLKTNLYDPHDEVLGAPAESGPFFHSLQEPTRVGESAYSAREVCSDKDDWGILIWDAGMGDYQ
jgi:hypothetical protein